MQIQISATLKTGKLIEGNNEWPMDVGFQKDHDTYAFYLHLARDKDIDAAGLLEDVLGSEGKSALRDCHVEDAGIFWMNRQTEQHAVMRLIGSLDKEAGDAVAKLIEKGNPLSEKCVCMWMMADLKNLPVLSGVIRIGYSNRSRLALLACFYKDENGQSNFGFYAELPDIELFSTIIFHGVRLKYVVKGGKSKSLALNGQIEIALQGIKSLFGDRKEEQGQYHFIFGGDLELDDEGYQASLGTVNEMRFLPFADRADLVFDKLVFQTSCRYEGEDGKREMSYFLLGEVQLAGTCCVGLIYFENGRMTFAQIRLDSGFSLARLWNWCFAECYWDEKIFDIKFLEGSFFSYCALENGFDVSEIHYAKGICVRLNTELTLMYTIRLTGLLNVSDGGFRALLTAENSVNLAFISIEGIKGGGPEFSFSCVKNQMGDERELAVSGRLCLLDTPLTESTVVYCSSRSGWEVRAQFMLPEIFQNIIARNIAVCYSKQSGFRFSLTSFSEQEFENANLDFLKTFEQMLDAGKGGCKAIQVGDKSKKKVHVRFKPFPKVSVSTDKAIDAESEDVSMEAVSNWSGRLWLEKVTITILYKENELLLTKDISMMEERDAIEVDGQTKLSELPGKLLSALEKAVEKIIGALFSEDVHYEELEKLLLYLFGDKLREYAIGFLCRKLIDQAKFSKLVRGGGAGGGGAGTGGAGAAAGGTAAAGGAAFGGGEMFQGIGAGFAGLLGMLLMTSGSGGNHGEEEKLPCPVFYGVVSGNELTLTIEWVRYAVDYEIDIMWARQEDLSDREDQVIRLMSSDSDGKPSVSLLTIPVYGKMYVAVRAIHKKPEYSSNWSELDYLTEVTSGMLAQWTKNAGYCLRVCFATLKAHGVDLGDAETMKEVLRIYNAPATPQQLVKEHHDRGDSAEQCMEHMEQAYPHLTSKELLTHFHAGGYQKEETILAIMGVRKGLTYEELSKIAEEVYENDTF